MGPERLILGSQAEELLSGVGVNGKELKMQTRVVVGQRMDAYSMEKQCHSDALDAKMSSKG